MTKEEFLQLTEKIGNGSATDKEIASYNSWYNQYGTNAVWDDAALGSPDDKKMQLFEAIQAKIYKPAAVTLWPRIAVASAVLFVLAAGLYFYNTRYSRFALNRYAGESHKANDIAPGRHGATLTLANGKKIRLSDAVNGEIAKEDGIKVTKTGNGQLVYEAGAEAMQGGNEEAHLINTLATARGETYQLRLPDGSMVWMNSASSLTYTARLNDDGKRVVRLSGEAYFEVSRDKKHPFIVRTSRQDVEVLGTHFNVNSYDDEGSTKTTLLEGSVRVGKNEVVVLKPNQQAILTGVKIKVKDVDPNIAIAWKNGNFVFNGGTIKEIMRSLSRWYDIGVIYEGKVTGELFYADISRYKNISQVLKMLERTNAVHFKIEGRRVTVSE